jgi:ABC-2 type transport system permease protein
MQTAHKPQPWITQLIDLVQIQLSNWRWSWRSILITSVMTPMLSIIALGIFARQESNQTLGYILTGNLVLALVFGTLSKVANNFAFIRARGMLHYFATLPIHSASLVLATVLAFFLLALPSVLATLLFGAWYLGLSLRISAWILIVLPLAASSLSGLGALIGTRARDPEESNAISLLVALVLVGLGPVLVPPERLPGFVLWLGYASPATYAASALRQTLLGGVQSRLFLDLAVLTAFSLLTLWWVGRTMSWRQSPV